MQVTFGAWRSHYHLLQPELPQQSVWKWSSPWKLRRGFWSCDVKDACLRIKMVDGVESNTPLFENVLTIMSISFTQQWKITIVDDNSLVISGKGRERERELQYKVRQWVTRSGKPALFRLDWCTGVSLLTSSSNSGDSLEDSVNTATLSIL